MEILDSIKKIIKQLIKKDFEYFQKFPSFELIYKAHTITIIIIFALSFLSFATGRENGDILGALGVGIIYTVVMFIILRILLTVLFKIFKMKPKIVKVASLASLVFIVSLSFLHLNSINSKNTYYYSQGLHFATDMLDTMGSDSYTVRAILKECINAPIYNAKQKREFIRGCKSVLDIYL